MNRIVLTLTLILSSLAVMAQDVAPMITAHWGQSSPYNLLCPKDSNTLIIQIAGCGPIAMAQLIRHMKYPATSPTTNQPYRYDLMLDELNHKSTREQIKAVDELIRDCGYEAKTHYGVGSSSTNPLMIANTLIKRFKYSKYLDIISTQKYPGEKGFMKMKELVFKELKEGRVVIASATSKAKKSGHIFLIDGIKDDKVHVNFGWNGRFDGYYPIDSIYKYNSQQYFIIGIRDSTYIPTLHTHSVYVEKPGTLAEKFTLEQWKEIEALKIEGHINNKDIYFLKDISQFDFVKGQRGNLYYLDLGNTDLVELPDTAFMGDAVLRHIILPKHLKSIGIQAFFGCSRLATIDMPASLSIIQHQAFRNCLNLLELNLPNGVKVIKNAAFVNCISLTRVTFPNSLTSIGCDIFNECI